MRHLSEVRTSGRRNGKVWGWLLSEWELEGKRAKRKRVEAEKEGKKVLVSDCWRVKDQLYGESAFEIFNWALIIGNETTYCNWMHCVCFIPPIFLLFPSVCVSLTPLLTGWLDMLVMKRKKKHEASNIIHQCLLHWLKCHLQQPLTIRAPFLVLFLKTCSELDAGEI